MGAHQLVVGCPLVGEEGGTGLEGGTVEEDGGGDTVAFPIGRYLGHGDTDVAWVEVGGISQQTQLVGRRTMVQQTDAAIEVVELLVGFDTHLAGKAKGLVEGEAGIVGHKAVADGHSVLGSDVGQVDGLALVVLVDVVDIAFGGVFLCSKKHHVGIADDMVFGGSAGQDGGVLDKVDTAALTDVEAVTSRGDDSVGAVDEEHLTARQLAFVIEIGGTDAVELEVVLGGVGRREAGARHRFVAEPFADVQTLQSAAGQTLGVLQVEQFLVDMPSELVDLGHVFQQRQVGTIQPLVALELGIAFVVVDKALHILGIEGGVVVDFAQQRELGDIAALLTRHELEVGTLDGALADGDGSIAGTVLGTQHHRPVEQRIATIHLEGSAASQLVDTHGVLVGEPMLVATSVENLGEGGILFDKEGVGGGHHRVRHEDHLFRLHGGAEVGEGALSTETVVAQADEVVVVAFAAIGGIAAARGLDDEAQRVVALHAEGFGDGGEDARRVELAVELQAVGLEAVHILDLERMHGIVETVADIGSVVVALAVVVDKAVFVAVEDGIFLGFLQPVVVVGTVNLDVAHQVVEGGVDDMLFVRVVELGDVEEHRVDLRHVEIELVVAKFDVGGVDNETASIDASVEEKVAVLVHLELALPRIDDHLLAVAKHKLLDAMHPQGVWL